MIINSLRMNILNLLKVITYGPLLLFKLMLISTALLKNNLKKLAEKMAIFLLQSICYEDW